MRICSYTGSYDSRFIRYETCKDLSRDIGVACCFASDLRASVLGKLGKDRGVLSMLCDNSLTPLRDILKLVKFDLCNFLG